MACQIEKVQAILGKLEKHIDVSELKAQVNKKIAEKQMQNKNGYVVRPNKAPDMKKAVYKASRATKYIGYGKPNSSTKLYEVQLKEQGMPINTGSYTKEDVVFVSVNGTPSKTDYINTLKQVVAALEAGATILTDSEGYLKTSTYNKGEQELAKYLISKGYTRTTSLDNSQVAEWRKIADKQHTNKIVNEESTIASKEEFDKLNTVKVELEGYTEEVNAKEDIITETALDAIPDEGC